MIHFSIRSLLITAMLLFFNSNTILFAQSPRSMSSSDLAVAIKNLKTLGSVLFIAAHPDDENTSVLAYLAKERGIRTAYLAMTRGEGGQNLLGPEQGEYMGIIRTQELLAARRIDGAEQRFARTIDFGFSKTSEETIRIWGREESVSDLVWIIRQFRPDVVISRFSPTAGGHGNHTASAIIAEEAFRAAGDPEKFPEQLAFVKPWQPKRLLWNGFRPQGDQSAPLTNFISVDVGIYNPLLGKSYTEIAGLSRSMHKSQGFGAAENRGSLINNFIHMAGDSAKTDLFDGVNLSWSRLNGGEVVGRILERAAREFNPQDPSKILPVLLEAYTALNSLKDEYWVDVKRKELLEVIRSAAGLWIDALASEYTASPGTDVRITTTFLNRSAFPFRVKRIVLPFGNRDTLAETQLQFNKPIQIPLSYRLPETLPLTQPYWLLEKQSLGRYVVRDQRLVGKPENDPALTIQVDIIADKTSLTLSIPVRHRWVDPVEGELYRPFEVVPAVAATILNPVTVYPSVQSKKIEVALKAGKTNVSGIVRLELPTGWQSKPKSTPFEISRKNDEVTVAFEVQPTNGAATGICKAVMEVDGTTYSTGIRTVEYKHIPPQALFPAAESKLVRVDLKKRGEKIGYIMGAGDDIPVVLKQIGYFVNIINDEDIIEGDLSRFDIIIAGVRAYNTRPQLRLHNKRLLDFIKQGGTYVVQYVTSQRGESENLAPFPLNISRDRVTVEEAPVTFLQPNHPLLTTPNKITQEDFAGWIQERGLCFADKWDPQFTSILSMNDPGESPKEGSLLVAQYGKGHYIFTGLAFFRQIPAGVPGAIRLFINLVSMGK
ncbi:MAG: PIG-L family deacetylase [bacterium]